MDGGGDNMDKIRTVTYLHPILARGDRLRLTYLYGGSVRYQPGECLGPRLLTDFEIVLIMEGRARYEADSAGYRLQPGSLILARPGFRERYAWDREGRTRHAYFHFGIETIPFAWPAPAGWPVVRQRPDPAVAAVFRTVLERSHRRGDSASGPPPALDTHLVETLIELVLEDPSAMPAPGDETERSEPVARALKRMRYLLEEEPQVSVSLPDLARHAGVSPKHLCRTFRESVGHPPMRTLRLLRLQLGLALLTRSSLTVQEVSSRCGFADPLYFSRCFSDAFGCSPRGFRNDLKRGRPPPPTPLPVDVTPRVHW